MSTKTLSIMFFLALICFIFFTETPYEELARKQQEGYKYIIHKENVYPNDNEIIFSKKALLKEGCVVTENRTICGNFTYRRINK